MKKTSFQIQVQRPKPRRKMPPPSRPIDSKGYDRNAEKTHLHLHFHPDGTATCLHTDTIPLQSLGHCRTRRASWIDFNEHTQEWEVRFDPHADSAEYSHPSRQACLDWERQHFNRVLS